MKVKLVTVCWGKKCKFVVNEIRVTKIADEVFMIFVGLKEPKYVDVLGYGWDENDNFHIDIYPEERTESVHGCLELVLVPENEEEKKVLDYPAVLYWCDKYGCRIILMSWDKEAEFYKQSKIVECIEQKIVRRCIPNEQKG